MNSINKKLSRTLLAVTALFFLAIALYLYQVIDGRVSTLYDESLITKVRTLATLMEYEPVEQQFEFEFADEVMTEFSRTKDPEYFQITLADGTLFESSVSLGAAALPSLDVELNQSAIEDITLPNGDAGRLIQLTFLPRSDHEDDDEENEPMLTELKEVDDKGNNELVFANQTVSISYARERESLNDTIRALWLLVGGGMIVSLLILGILMNKIIRRQLSPLNRLAEQISGIDENALDQRIDTSGEQLAELAPINRQVNKLLDRIQTSFERIKLFSSNVAHELNTPLAELRTLSEVAPQSHKKGESVDDFFLDVNDISVQMQNTVSNLFELTQLENNLVTLQVKELSLRRLLDETWKQVTQTKATVRQYTNHIPHGLLVKTDQEKLKLALGNLLSNAYDYSPEHSQVVVTHSQQLDDVSIQISNETASLNEEDIERLSDRFWRKDESRTDSTHSGLGLSIVEAIAEALNLKMDYSLSADSVLVVSLSGLLLTEPTSISKPLNLDKSEAVDSGLVRRQTADH